MSFDWGSVIGAAVSLWGAKEQSDAAKDAGKQATQAQQSSDALQKYIYDDQRNLAMPGYNAGLVGLNQYMAMLGLGGIPQTQQAAPVQQQPQLTAEQYYLQQNPDVAAHDKYGSNPYAHYLKYGRNEGRSWGAPAAPVAASQPAVPAASNKTPEQLQQEAFAAFRAAPGYQFGLDEGNKQVQASAAARGGLNSGATLKALMEYGQNYADQQGYTPYMNKLASLWGGAQTATNQIGNAGQNYANQTSQNAWNGANARANSTYNSANAWMQGANNAAGFAGQWYQNTYGGGR